MARILPRRKHTHSRIHLVRFLVPQHAQHGDVVRLAARLLEDAPALREHDCVGGDDERGVRDRGEAVVQRGLVHREALLVGRLQDVLEGFEGFREVLGFGGGEDFEVREADLRGSLFSRPGINWSGGVTVLERGVVFAEDWRKPR